MNSQFDLIIHLFTQIEPISLFNNKIQQFTQLNHQINQINKTI